MLGLRPTAVLVLLLVVHCGGASAPEGATPAAVATPTRDRMRDVQAALARGEPEKAAAILENFAATEGETPKIRDARDAIAIAEAATLTGAARLELLDPIGARGGAHAKEAAKLAKAERLREVQQLVDAQKPAEALAAIEQWFGDLRTADPEVAEARARAHDAAWALCADLACRYAEGSKADASARTSERASRVTDARTALTAALSFQEIPGEALPSRLSRLRNFIETASTMSRGLVGDPELQAKAGGAKDWAQAERAKVALLGSDEATASELLGPLAAQGTKVAMAPLGPVLVYLSFDSQKRCRGVYLVGSSSTSRALDANDEALRRIVSQAVGHAATLKPTASTNTRTSSWSEGAIPIVARWRQGVLMELRIGDATP
jgi:hypothetical protein